MVKELLTNIGWMKNVEAAYEEAKLHSCSLIITVYSICGLVGLVGWLFY